MACENKCKAIAKLAGRISGAISPLSGKQAFLAGVVVGASGTGLGTFIVTRRRSLANFWRGRQKQSGGVQPTISRPKPRSIPGLSAAPPARPKPKPIPGLGRQSLSTLSDAPQTKLRAAAVRVLDSNGQPFTAQNSYQVLRPDGSDTGLALTPHLEQGRDGQTAEKEGNWSVTHTGTGALVDGPYDSLAQAQGLATELSLLRWTTAKMPKAEINRAKEIIGQYRQALPKAGLAKNTRQEGSAAD